MPNISGVAPDDMLQQDFRMLDTRETLRCAWKSERNLLIQSVIGHAHEGHGLFRGRRYVNTTMDDIARALDLDPVAVRRERQSLIDGVAEYVGAVLSGDTNRLLVDSDGQPLLTMGTLPLLEVDGPGVLRGLYLGALRDDTDIRAGAESRYNIKIGGGESYIVDLEVMEREELDADRLAHEDHDAETIERYRDIGLIVADDGPDSDETAYTYIRHRRGTGTSDDACIVITGLLYGFSAGVGAFLADALDTLEKYVPVFGGADAILAKRIENDLPDLAVTRQDAEDIAYLSADESGDTPDSSLRHLLSVDRRCDQCAAETHLLYLLGRPYGRLGLSHKRSPNDQFYEYCEQRLRQWRERY